MNRSNDVDALLRKSLQTSTLLYIHRAHIKFMKYGLVFLVFLTFDACIWMSMSNTDRLKQLNISNMCEQRSRNATLANKSLFVCSLVHSSPLIISYYNCVDDWNFPFGSHFFLSIFISIVVVVFILLQADYFHSTSNSMRLE